MRSRPPFGAHGVNGIADQVAEDLQHFALEASDGLGGAIAPFDPDPGIQQASLVKRNGGINQFGPGDLARVGGLAVKAQCLIGDGRNAAKLDLCAGQMASGLGIERGMLREVDKIGHRCQRVIDFVGDGAGESTDGIELFRLQQKLFGAPVFSHVDAEHDDAGNVAVGIAPRLIHKIQITQFEVVRFSVQQLDRHIVADEWLAGLIHAIEYLYKSLFFRFRNRLFDGFAHRVAMANEFAVRGIHQFVPVLGSAECGEKGRSLLEQLRKALAFRVPIDAWQTTLSVVSVQTTSVALMFPAASRTGLYP